MKTNSESLNALYDALADTLKKTLVEGKVILDKDGEAVSVTPDASTLNVIRQFLKDANVSVAPGTNEVVNDIASHLPFSGEEHTMQ